MIVTDRKYLEETRCEDTTIEYCEANKVFDLLAVELKASKTPGVGLAAIQIGLPIRASYIEYRHEDTDYVYKIINPKILSMSKKIIYPNEGCLSDPDHTYNTDRYTECTVTYLDFDTREQKTLMFGGFLAVVLQHEIDHLDNILNYKREHHDIKLGRNDLCFCGSGKKYKKCCLV